MTAPNAFQRAAFDLHSTCHRVTSKGRIVKSLDGIEAKPLSSFSEHGQMLLLGLIAHGEIGFLVLNDVLLIPQTEIDPYLPVGDDRNA